MSTFDKDSLKAQAAMHERIFQEVIKAETEYRALPFEDKLIRNLENIARQLNGISELLHITMEQRR